ncbi:MAG TPA: hypothetical protein DD393_01110 [Ruminococcaceae bacterium]|nr:hypothetical protein [Oscillospiraceae bacterium]
MKNIIALLICRLPSYISLTPLTSQLTTTEKMFDGFFILALLIVFVIMFLISKKLKKGFLKGVSVFWTICIGVLIFIRLVWFISSL